MEQDVVSVLPDVYEAKHARGFDPTSEKSVEIDAPIKADCF
jgi:hypothetical protein